VPVSAAVIAGVLVGGSSGRPSTGRRLASRAPTAGLEQFARRRPRRILHPGGATALAPIERVLAYTPYITLGSLRKRDLALTFDDGPGPYTAQILRVLERTRIPATFFVIGKWALRYPQLVRAEARAGDEVGDHTETHPLMSLLPAAEQQAQLLDAGQAVHRAGAPFPHLWRPPYGAFNGTTLTILHRLGMLLVLWTVDTSDYARPGVPRIAYTAISGARPGAIILLHDGGGDRAQTVTALPKIIAALRRHHYRLVTLSQLLADDPPPRHHSAPQPLYGRGV
jgi:peptidoglycan-N-acetylglucosamine deacetylase